MKRSCSSISQLNSLIANAIESTLQNEVKRVAEVKIRDHIKSDVYDVYSPVVYERRNILKQAKFGKDLWNSGTSITLRLFSTALPSPSIKGTPYYGSSGEFAQWINDGRVPNIFNNQKYIWNSGRPFYDRAVEDLEATSDITLALKAGLKKHGISTN